MDFSSNPELVASDYLPDANRAEHAEEIVSLDESKSGGEYLDWRITDRDWQIVGGEFREIEPAPREMAATFELTCGCETQSMKPSDHKDTCSLRKMLVSRGINNVIVTHRPGRPDEFKY